MSDVSYGPWHTLRLSDAVWYCDLVRADDPAACVPQSDCAGHDVPHPGRVLELDREIGHPAECVAPPCCCTWPERRGGIDPNCGHGLHDQCLNRGRCYTETQVYEWWDIEEMPTTAGDYRVRVWGSGPDYNGEYDGGIDWEPVPADEQKEKTMLTPDRIAEINLQAKGDPMALAEALTAELNQTERERDVALAERDEARQIAILMRRWAGTPATRELVDRNLELQQVPHWLIDDTKDQT